MQLTRLIDRLRYEKAYILGFPVPLHYLLLFILFAAVIYGLHSWLNRDKWNTLVHEQYNFSIDYPANWTHEIYGVRGLKNFPDLKAQIGTNQVGFVGSVSKSLEVSWVPMDDPTPEKIIEWDLERVIRHQAALSDLQEIEVGVGQYPALTRTIRYTDKSQMIIQYFIIHDDNVYLLEFFLRNAVHKDEAIPIFNQMLSSFHLIN